MYRQIIYNDIISITPSTNNNNTNDNNSLTNLRKSTLMKLDCEQSLFFSTVSHARETLAPSVTRVCILARFVRRTMKKERLLVVYDKIFFLYKACVFQGKLKTNLGLLICFQIADCDKRLCRCNAFSAFLSKLNPG